MSNTITPAEFAEVVGSDAKTVRRFLRANDIRVGKGNRHSLPADKRGVATLSKAFANWKAERETKKADSAVEVETETPNENESE